MSRVFAFYGGNNSVTVIEATNGKVVGTIDLGGGPEFAAAGGRSHDTFSTTWKMRVWFLRSMRASSRSTSGGKPGCESPSSMATDRPNRRLFIGCRSRVMAVRNAHTGQVIITLPIGDHVDATAFDPETRLIFNSKGEALL